MMSYSSKPSYTRKEISQILSQKVSKDIDGSIFESIANIMIEDQPENEEELSNLVKTALDEFGSTGKEEEIISSSKAIYGEMLNFGFKPAKKVEKSEGLKRWEEAQANARKLVPDIVIHHDRDESHKVDINLENITITIGNKIIVEDATLKINYGRRYVLIGRNGLGKTTLLNHIASKEIEGIPQHLQILHVEQEVVANDNCLIDEVLSVDVERTKLLKEHDEIEEKLYDDDKLPEDELKELKDRYLEVSERLQAIDSGDAEQKATEILSGLGFSTQDMSKATKKFSGGWRMRISLAKALFAAPDILLLDEPTNHLDMEAVMWLEDYLIDWPYTMIIVSHARNFINNVATDIINFTNNKFVYYKGNYTDYEKAKKERTTNMNKIRDRQVKEIAHMQSFIDRFRANAKRASLAQSKIKAVNKIVLSEEVLEDPTVMFIFPEVQELSSPLLKLNDVTLGYEKKIIIGKTTFSVDMESRIAVVGPNGAGKSTLMKCLNEQLEAMEGSIYRHPKLKVAMFTQHHIDQLNLDFTPIQTIMQIKGETQPEPIRFYLASFGITGDLSIRPNYMLSGGQKTRVALAALVYTNPHIILMDEPTNHMDIDAVNALGVALNAYNGGVVIVSHDQHFVESVCDTIFIVGKKKCTQFKGTFAEYKKLIRKNK